MLSALNHWRPYFLGKAFDIVTDLQSLTWLPGLKNLRGRLALWILALQDYEFEINYKLRKQHSNADTLALFPRVTSTPALEGGSEEVMTGEAAIEICTSWSSEEIITAQKDDPNISLVMHRLSGPETPAGYEGILVLK